MAGGTNIENPLEHPDAPMMIGFTIGILFMFLGKSIPPPWGNILGLIGIFMPMGMMVISTALFAVIAARYLCLRAIFLPDGFMKYLYVEDRREEHIPGTQAYKNTLQLGPSTKLKPYGNVKMLEIEHQKNLYSRIDPQASKVSFKGQPIKHSQVADIVLYKPLTKVSRVFRGTVVPRYVLWHGNKDYRINLGETGYNPLEKIESFAKLGKITGEDVIIIDNEGKEHSFNAPTYVKTYIDQLRSENKTLETRVQDLHQENVEIGDFNVGLQSDLEGKTRGETKVYNLVHMRVAQIFFNHMTVENAYKYIKGMVGWPIERILKYAVPAICLVGVWYYFSRNPHVMQRFYQTVTQPMITVLLLALIGAAVIIVWFWKFKK